MQDLKIAQKWEDMMKYAYVSMRNIPKSERFTLGSEIRVALWDGLKTITRANYTKNKMALLIEIDITIKTLQAMARTGHAMRIIDNKKYEILSAKLVEIGKMLGGWIKSQKKG